MASREADPENVERLVETGWTKCATCRAYIDPHENWSIGSDQRARCEDCQE